MCPILLLISLFSQPLLTLWLGSEFAINSYRVIIFFSIGIMFNSLSQVSFAYVQGAGHAKFTFFIHFLELLLYVPLLIILTNYYGINGAAIAWSVRAIIDFFFLSYGAIRIIKLQG